MKSEKSTGRNWNEKTGYNSIVQNDNTGLKKYILHTSFKRFFILLFSFFILSALPAQAQETNIGGKASYYSNSLHGRRMSSGKIYHRDSLTCAHKTLPFGTKLKVTNPANGKEVIVEVADRGPYSHNRIIDLSYAAARELGIIAHGVKYVKIEILPEDHNVSSSSTSSLFSMLETEYGMAGMCYEFIPEWSDGRNILPDSKDETTPSSSAARTNQTHKKQGGEKQGTGSNAAIQQQTQSNTPKRNIQNGQQTNAPKQQNKKEPVKKEQSSSSWMDFFDKLKNWGESLFE